MEITQILDSYCIARSIGQKDEQLEIADQLVDEYIPSLIQRLGQAIIDRNKAWNDKDNLNASL